MLRASLVYGDLIGLEVVLRILDVMLKETNDNGYLSQLLLSG